MTTNKKLNNNVFQNIVRDVVKEELKPVKEDINLLKTRVNTLNLKVNALDLKMDSVEDNLKDTFREYVDKVLVSQDQVMGELKTIRQEQIMHQGQHDDLNGLPEKVEKLAALIQAG